MKYYLSNDLNGLRFIQLPNIYDEYIIVKTLILYNYIYVYFINFDSVNGNNVMFERFELNNIEEEYISKAVLASIFRKKNYIIKEI